MRDDLLSNTSFNVTLTVLLQDVQSLVRSLVETDRSGPCHHRALVVHAFRRLKIEFNRTQYIPSKLSHNNVNQSYAALTRTCASAAA